MEQINYSELLNQLFYSGNLAEKLKIFKNYIEQWDYTFNIVKITNPNDYNYERLHTNLICALLDPQTPVIANAQYVHIFIGLINNHYKKDNKKEINYYFPNGYYVKKDKHIDTGTDIGGIDILIYDNENAIIIENKSNNANDTGNQLAKYYKYVKEKMGLNVIAVVYIPLDPSKKPDFMNYSDEYKDYIPEINYVLVILPVIDGSSDDFVHGFLEKCINSAISKGNQTAVMFLSQLVTLFKYLGGKNMTTNLDRDAIIEIYADKEKITKFELVGALWGKKDEIINNMIKELLSKSGFKEHFDDPNETMYYEICNEFSLGYTLRGKDFGFVYTPGKELSKDLHGKLKYYLDNENFKDIFVEKPIHADHMWVRKAVDFNKVIDFSNIIFNFDELKKSLIK